MAAHNTHRPKFGRLIKVASLIRQGGHNCTTIAAALETCPRTIYRDIEYLRDCCELPVEFHCQTNTYKLTRPWTIHSKHFL